jgi:hypothetical protein
MIAAPGWWLELSVKSPTLVPMDKSQRYPFDNPSSLYLAP